ncbi:permease [Thermincola potens]|uniref:Permease n=1 Tax=Thermincola potens (strain JR) TaxID=635013 RepID=D5XB20_THEPJ|nr:permease [Thermincola potens]ADG81340.1 permease [Thermincola potens JR]
MWQQFVNYLVYDLMGLSPESHLGSAVNFFIYDTVKILFMLSLIIFFVAIIRSFFPPEKTRKILSHKRKFIGNIIAALLGIVTPFCSCSAVPVFIGFVEAGVPLGVTFSFLISSPMVNEVALGMLWMLFGWKIALIYIASGITVAIVAGLILGRMNLERLVEDYVYKISSSSQCACEVEEQKQTWRDRIDYARAYVAQILKKVWPYVVIGIAIGAVMHGYAPENFLAKYAGPKNPFAVPLAVLIGIPLYSNAAGTIPIVKELVRGGMAMGTALSFMMAVTALSLPEAIILKQVLKPKLLVIYFGIVGLGIIGTGYLFNMIL